MSSSGFDSMSQDDAVAFFDCCSVRFGELAALFEAIAQRIDEHENLHKLATLGKYAASDYENMAGCWGEQLEKGGIRK